MSTETNSAIIYLIDDELIIRDSIKSFIESVGLKIICFASAEAFLSNYDHHPPNCLILDVKMPMMDGLQLQEELLKRQIDIPIIFISGHADISVAAKAFKAGAFDFLEKPFDNTLLLERINEVIKKDVGVRSQHIEDEYIRSRFDRLTVREKEVLKLIINHHSSKKVAKELDISPRTIDAHRARIIEKMQAANIVDLVAKVAGYPFLYDF
jgi:FixJ family two-component response regulator